MKSFLLILLLTTSFSVAQAQIKGTVLDSAGKKPIDKITVGLVIKSNPKDTAYSLTDERGNFCSPTFPVAPSPL
jgi:hypothetical protein